ncbi:hypothetical protein [Microbacterium sp.]|uniref:hypothetical protein n=1 Tax=Microbacterium sp. TaxID=51671 RepID=UPI003A916CC8
MTWVDGFFFPDTVTVRDRTGGGGMGSGYGQPRTLAAETIDVQQIVRDASGQEVVSSSRVTVPLDANVPIGSLVTVWPGKPGAEREAEVLQVGRDENPPPLPSHQILWLK